MPIEILMPALSPTMTEGNLAKWIKKEGDKISAGEVIAEIETDKATMEVEAVDEGVLAKILVDQGTENVAVNSCIALILEEGEDDSALENYQPSSLGDNKKEQPNSKELDAKTTNKEEGENKEAITQPAIDSSAQIEKTNIIKDSNAKAFDGNIKASPLAKRIAKDEGVSLYQLQGTGPNGRIVKDDVVDFLRNPSSMSAVRRNAQLYKEVANNNFRKVIAKRLLESKQNVPHFYLSCELNLTNLLDLRVTINNEAPMDQSGKPIYKISVNDLIIKASAMALSKVPEANSSWSEDAIKIYNNVDISVAVAIDGGLITPIIKNADQKSIKDISSEMKILAKKAREGKLALEEFQGGSFSISNLGMYGIDNFSAIINPPQSCILAVSRAVEKPIIKDHEIAIASMMNVTLSSDHRVVDGAVGANFLKELRKYIENPILMLL